MWEGGAIVKKMEDFRVEIIDREWQLMVVPLTDIYVIENLFEDRSLLIVNWEADKHAQCIAPTFSYIPSY